MKVGVSGSRMKYWGDKGWVYLRIWEELCRVLRRIGGGTTILHGCNYRSADLVAELFGASHGLDVVRVCPPAWTRHALLRRNRLLAENSDILVCFFVNRITPGTAHTCREAIRRKKTVEIVLIEG